jgi:beta-fructofuranosidase
MGFRLKDRWVWDSWFAVDADALHLFYLQAPRTLGDPDLRHDHSSVGHAVTTDFEQWEVLPDALTPGRSGGWDDLAIWTGSVIRGPDDWQLWYTGRTHADGGWSQRIGRAASDDLVHWRRLDDRPILEADPCWYEAPRPANGPWHELAWRDPFLLADPEGAGWHALITARRATGEPSSRRVIGHATSPDLAHWTVRPPFASPAGFGHLEVPEVVKVDGHAYLVWCTQREATGRDRLAGPHGDRARSGTYIVRAPSLLGPFDLPASVPVEPYSERYAGRLVPFRGRCWFVGFIDRVDGAFVGELADPEPFDASRVTVAVGARDSEP